MRYLPKGKKLEETTNEGLSNVKRALTLSTNFYVAQMALLNLFPFPIVWLSFVLYHLGIGCHSCWKWQCVMTTHGSFPGGKISGDRPTVFY